MLIGSWYPFGSLSNFGETGQFQFGVCSDRMDPCGTCEHVWEQVSMVFVLIICIVDTWLDNFAHFGTVVKLALEATLKVEY